MELLLITGAVDAYGQFTADWWSTPERECATASDAERPAEWHVAAIDSTGKVLVWANATLTERQVCSPGGFRLDFAAVLPLSQATSAVVVRHRGNEVLRRTVPAPAQLHLGEAFRGRQPREPVQVPVHIDGPAPGPGAYLVGYWEAPGQPLHPVGMGRLDDGAPSLTVDLTTVPGGPGCRLTVAYFDGIRTTRATIDELHLEERPAKPVIMSPLDGARIFDDTWLSLIGRLDGDGDPEALDWLVDNEVIGQGTQAGASGLAVGRHVVALRYGTTHDQVQIEVEPLPAEPDTTPDWEPPWRSRLVPFGEPPAPSRE